MPVGTHEVEIVYHAPGLKMGKVLSVTGLLLLAGMMVTVQRLTGLKKTDGVD